MPIFKLIRLEEEAYMGDLYSECSRESMTEDDILTPEEAAFMKGWDEA